MEIIEGFEVAIALLIEKVAICELYAGIYSGVPLPSGSAADREELQSMLDSALPGLYAAVIVFGVKVRSYFEATGTYTIYQT